MENVKVGFGVPDEATVWKDMPFIVKGLTCRCAQLQKKTKYSLD